MNDDEPIAPTIPDGDADNHQPEPEGVATPEEIISVTSPEELAALCARSMVGLKDPALVDDTIAFLAGTISSLQLQHMQMLSYIEHVSDWCMMATPIIRKLNTKLGAPWPFGVWCLLMNAKSPEEAQQIKEAYWKSIQDNVQAQGKRIITLGN